MSGPSFTKSTVEDAALTWMESVGWTIAYRSDVTAGHVCGSNGLQRSLAGTEIMGQMSKGAPNSPLGEVIVYEAPDGEVRVDVRLKRKTVWLTQQQMAELFGRERSVVTKHIRNVFREGELDPAATCAKFAQVQSEGERRVSREVDYYNLDVIISVGYRVKSLRGTQFRQWATRTLRDHLLSGYTLNERRLRVKDTERFIGRVV